MKSVKPSLVLGHYILYRVKNPVSAKDTLLQIARISYCMVGGCGNNAVAR
jgi:hypothetical protein